MFKGKLNFKKSAFRYLFIGQILIVSLLFVFPLIVQAQTDPVSLDFHPQVPIPGSAFSQESVKVGSYSASSGKMVSNLLPLYIMAIYNYGLAIVGILATLVLMGGGLLWLTSGGDAGKITQAKELITGSVSGVIILVVAWIILNTINPNLVNFKPIETIYIIKTSYCCDSTKGHIPTDKDGKCPSNSQKLVDNQKCYNSGSGNTNSFTAVDPTKKTCCEYAMGTTVKCVTTDTTCPTTPPGYKFIKHHPGYYCGDKVMVADSCLAGSCAGKKDGDKCEGLNSDYCYNEICWFGVGKATDPCGDQPFSRCDANLPQNGKKCNEDWTNKRKCATPLACCKFLDKDGLNRKND